MQAAAAAACTRAGAHEGHAALLSRAPLRQRLRHRQPLGVHHPPKHREPRLVSLPPAAWDTEASVAVTDLNSQLTSVEDGFLGQQVSRLDLLPTSRASI